MIKKLLYGLFFLFVFLVSVYLTFPTDALRPYVTNLMTEGLASQSSGVRLLTPPKVTIWHLSLWRLSGVSLTDVTLQLGSETYEPGPEFQLKKLKIRLALLSSLFGSPKIQFDSEIYKGRARGYVKLDSKGNLSDLWLDLDRIDLEKLRGPVSSDELQVAGELNLDVNVSLGKKPSKDGTGEISLDAKGLSVGPGAFEVPGGFGGSMSLPKTRLGHFVIKADFKQGKAKVKNIKLEGGDLQADINATVELSDSIVFSPLKGSGWFKVEPEYLKENPKFSALLEFSPDIKAAEDAEGKVHFTLIGSLMNPTPKWGKE